MRVLVAYAAPGVERLVEITLPQGAVVADAVAASGLIEQLPIDAATLALAIFGQRVTAQTPLRDGDRVELLRPLAVDPKDARRRRARTDRN